MSTNIVHPHVLELIRGNELWNSWDLRRLGQGDTMALDESDEEWYSQVIGQSGEHKPNRQDT